MALTEKQYQVVDETVRRRWNVDQWNITDCACAAAEAVLALERPSATEPAMKCRSCDTTTDKTPPFAACGICGAQLVDKVATEPAAQDEALVEKLEQVLRESFDCASFRTIAKDIIAVARQHFAAHPVTAQVPEGYVRLEDVRAALLSGCGESCYWSSVVEKAMDSLAPKQKTPEAPETVDALDQLAMSLQWEQLYTDDYKRSVLREAVQFVLQGGAHERTPTP